MVELTVKQALFVDAFPDYIFGKEALAKCASGKEKSLMSSEREVAPFCEKYVSCAKELGRHIAECGVQNQHKKGKC